MDAALNELIQDLASTAVPAATHLDQERYSALVSLTEKQRRYIVLLCDERELSVAQMADEMGTTVSAVEKCSRAVRKKLRVRTALALALVAMRAGLVK